MILYRIVGRAEAFPECGLLRIEPTTYSTRATGMKRLKAIARGFDKGKLVKRYDIRLEKISIPSVLTKEQIMGLMAEEIYLDDLIEEREEIFAIGTENLHHESVELPQKER